MGQVGDFDFTSNCHGLAIADGQVVVNDPATVLEDEYTQVGQMKGENAGDAANTKDDIVTVGIDELGSISHSAVNNGNGTYTDKNDMGKVKPTQTIEKVVDFYGTGEAGAVESKDLDVHLYKKNYYL